ncbi:MAG: hypothetical protein JSR63_07830 [Proteobacteria bacterium]|nr:hypothetical protein [Pseudomonadota bacterium]
MANQAEGTAIRLAIQAKLQTITVAAGYRTDIGLNVVTEAKRWVPADGPRVTVFPGHKMRPQDAIGRPTEREFRHVIEVLIPADYDTAAAQVEAAEADIEDALRGYPLMPNATPSLFEESMVLERPDGVPAMALQMIRVLRYR